jgi:hypothetical protein
VIVFNHREKSLLAAAPMGLYGISQANNRTPDGGQAKRREAGRSPENDN